MNPNANQADPAPTPSEEDIAQAMCVVSLSIASDVEDRVLSLMNSKFRPIKALREAADRLESRQDVPRGPA